jgi:ribokinase
VTVVDTVGAGDALVGALAAALDRGTAWPRALRQGLAAGSLACTRAGAQTALPWRDEIAALADTI